jgi:ADP-ribose pyrophosphatase YjhB (NUDIX family)
VKQRRRIAAYGVSHDADGRVLLVRASAQDDAPGHWGLPGGGIEHGEAPRDAAVREYQEETGLAVELVRLRQVISDVVPLPARGIVMHTDRVVYDTRIVGGSLRHEVDGTSDLAEWVDPERLAGLPLLGYVRRALGLPIPAGRPLIDSVAEIDPGRNRVQRFAAYGLVTDPAGRLLLTRISEGYPGAGSWHLPGGGTDFGELPEDGLLRELDEETGQRGRVVRLLDVTHFRNPAAMGPEGRPLDWHTVRVLYRVMVDDPTSPRVVEATGGSTDRVAWYDRVDLSGIRLNQFARSVIAAHLD